LCFADNIDTKIDINTLIPRIDNISERDKEYISIFVEYDFDISSTKNPAIITIIVVNHIDNIAPHIPNHMPRYI
jgi:hypothetical protein